MARTLDDVIGGLSLDQQQEIEMQAAHLIEDEMVLRDLCKAHALTQERIVEKESKISLTNSIWSVYP